MIQAGSRWKAWLPIVGACVLALSLVRQWLYVGTYRLYLDQRLESAQEPANATRQRFEIRGDQVDPQILADSGARLDFAADYPWRSTLRFTAVPDHDATIEVVVAENGTRRTLARRTLTQAAEIAVELPPIAGTLELANTGALRWSDPRVVQEPDYGPRLLGLGALLGLSFVRRRKREAPLPQARAPRVLLAGFTACISIVLALLVLEAGLRLLGSRLPGWVSAQRRDLGEVQMDPRWQESPRYGRRLAPGIRTFCEWRQGDIVRMGFLPPGLIQHPAYRFPFVTDADGFRNAPGSSRPTAIAALGDSFTDAMTLPRELAWPSRLAGALGTVVGNYGTAGFGPGQERLVLEQYVVPRRPKLVVAAFFAGNDLHDAESFLAFERGAALPATQGWKFKQVIARFDRLYLTSLYQATLARLGEPEPGATPSQPSPAPGDWSGDGPPAPAARAAFDQGLFSVPGAGRTLRFAFLPAYLNGLGRSRAQIESSRGWELTRSAYRQMARFARSGGGELVVLFIPSKEQVYLPLLQASFAAADLRDALRFCLRDQPYAPSLEELMRNRLALNALMRSFCADEGIAFFDATPALEAAVRAGRNVYFPDDSHWNAAGHETAAAALARFLTERGLVRPDVERRQELLVNAAEAAVGEDRHPVSLP